MFGGQLPFYSVAPQTPLATMANLGFMENDSFSSFSSFLPSFSSSSSVPSSSYSWLKFARGLQWTAWGVCGGGGLLPPVPTLDPPLVGNGGHTGYLQKLLPLAYVSCRVRVIQKSLCAAVR
jgi:hypothetical protein